MHQLDETLQLDQYDADLCNAVFNNPNGEFPVIHSDGHGLHLETARFGRGEPSTLEDAHFFRIKYQPLFGLRQRYMVRDCTLEEAKEAFCIVKKAIQDGYISAGWKWPAMGCIRKTLGTRGSLRI